MQVTVFRDLFNATDVPYIVPIDKIIRRTKEGSSKENIEKVRLSKSEKEKNKLKKKLPAILFSGEFSQRNKDGCTEHSGLMITDFDKFPSKDEYIRMWDLLKKNEHIFFMFRSPSGNGIKAVVRIPQTDKFDHERYFKSFNDEFQYDYFDPNNCDISRVCFESYDPDAYVNKESTIFSPTLVDDGYEVKEYISYTPLIDEDKIIERIMAWNWKKDFVDGERNNFIFDIAGAFCEFGISQNTAVGYIQNNVVIGDFSQKEVETTIKNVYKKRAFSSRFFENYEKKKKLEKDIKSKNKDVIQKDYSLDDEQYDEVKTNVEQENFWYFEEDKKGKKKAKIDPFKYKFFLEINGFKKFFPNDSQKPTWVKIESNKVSETSTERIKDFVLDFLLSNNHLKVWSYCVNYQILFSENFLLMLETIDLMMLKDTRKKSYIAYQNGILEVTENGSKLVDYIDVDGYIWKSQIINREFESLDKFDNEYRTFIKNISNNKPDAIEAVLGYLLSGYKNKMNNKAIILNDEVISENPEGGTGKGLFIQGLRQIRMVSILDGKTFDDKKSFPYQTVSQDTQILVFDDIKKNWDFESKFSIVTEGITLERKNKDAIKLSVEESPKMVVSTNYAVKGAGNSHERRRHEIEVSQYYGKHLTPYDEFGKQLFDDWTDAEFLKFDNYMVYCLMIYLKSGLIKQDAKNINMRKFIAETNMEFYEWSKEEEGNIITGGKRLYKGDLYLSFISDYPDYGNGKFKLSQKMFRKYLSKFGEYFDYKVNHNKDMQGRYVEFLGEGETQSEDEDIAF